MHDGGQAGLLGQQFSLLQKAAQGALQHLFPALQRQNRHVIRRAVSALRGKALLHGYDAAVCLVRRNVGDAEASLAEGFPRAG